MRAEPVEQPGFACCEVGLDLDEEWRDSFECFGWVYVSELCGNAGNENEFSMFTSIKINARLLVAKLAVVLDLGALILYALQTEHGA